MTVRPLTGRQARFLRSLGHHLEPTVIVGQAGVTEGIHRQVDEALTAHELIKVKVGQGCGADRREVAREISEAAGAAVAQVLGKTILLYREGDPRRIQLP